MRLSRTLSKFRKNKGGEILSNQRNVHPVILQYLQDLSNKLEYLSESERVQSISEVEVHLQDLFQEKIERGIDTDLAAHETVNNFLSVDILAEQITNEVDVMQAVNSKQNGSKKKNNSKAFNSLIFGIISILLPFIGIIFGSIGVIVSRKAKKEILNTDEGGSKLASVGFFCSVIGIIIQIIVIVGFISFNFMTIEG